MSYKQWQWRPIMKKALLNKMYVGSVVYVLSSGFAHMEGRNSRLEGNSIFEDVLTY